MTELHPEELDLMKAVEAGVGLEFFRTLREAGCDTDEIIEVLSHSAFYFLLDSQRPRRSNIEPDPIRDAVYDIVLSDHWR